MQVSVKRNAGCPELSIVVPWGVAFAILMVFRFLILQAPHEVVSREVALFGVLLLYIAFGISWFRHARFFYAFLSQWILPSCCLALPSWDGQVMLKVPAFDFLVCSAVAICVVFGVPLQLGGLLKLG